MIKTGAQILIDCLIKENVKIIFGIPGGAVLPIFDELYHSRNQLQFILTRHEQGAGHMADGYARSTGEAGVCLVTSGPGMTNLITAIATAYTDSIPLIAITGQVDTTLIGSDAFQEADTAGITRGITKYNFLVNKVDELALVIREAFYIAKTGRPGPVVIDIPLDIQKNQCEFSWPESISLRGYHPHYEGHMGQIKKAAKLINQSLRPLLYVGGGVIYAGASDILLQIAETTQTPATTTLMALGAIPIAHPLSLGIPGMHGSYAANMAFHNSDLIIAVGTRFDNRVTGDVQQFAPQAKIIHIDIDPASIVKNVRVDIPIVGNAKQVLLKLQPLLKPQDHSPWLHQLQEWHKDKPFRYSSDNRLHAPYIIEKLSELTKGDAIIVTDAGQHQMWAAQYYRFRFPRHFISSGGQGTMGFGLPAAIGAKLANPSKIVILITGDGSFQMTLEELAVLAINRLDIKIIMMQNDFFGLPRQWQDLFYHQHTFAVDLRTPDGSLDQKYHFIPDFCALAKAYELEAVKLERKDQVDTILSQYLFSNQACFINCFVNQLDNVSPLILPGSPIDQMPTEEEL